MKQSRRTFLGAAGLMIAKPRLVRGAEANSAIRIGLLGCGGRGTEDATSMVEKAGGRIVALADLFSDQLEKAKARFNDLAAKRGHSAIDASQIFLGPHAFEQMAASKEVDAVVIATPPYFHPKHLAAVVEAGKHVYCEKPVAVDVAGAKRVLEIGRRAEGRLSLDVGLQIRHAPPFVELVKRIHAGALGEIAFGDAHYHCPFLGKGQPRTPTPEERLRNWMYDRVLSGDIVVEQNIHAIDICNWVLKGHPVKAAGMGGRKGRSEFGDCLGHSAITFWYPDDVHVSFNSKQFGKGGGLTSARVFLERAAIRSRRTRAFWVFRARKPGRGRGAKTSKGRSSAPQARLRITWRRRTRKSTSRFCRVSRQASSTTRLLWEWKRH